MTKYPIFQPWIYVPGENNTHQSQCYSVEFPTTWAENLNQIGERIAQLKSWSTPFHVPYWSLSSLMLLTMPGLVSHGFEQVHLLDSSVSPRRLLAAIDLEPTRDVLAFLVQNWVRFQYEHLVAADTLPGQEAWHMLQNILESIKAEHLSITSHTVNIRCPELNTQHSTDDMLRRIYYKAVPAWLVSQIEGQTVTLGDYTATLARTQSLSTGTAELMTWPPYYVDRKYALSLVLEFTTIIWPETASVPRILPRWHVRRWLRQSLYGEDGYIDLPTGRSSSVYLRTRTPWIEELYQSDPPNTFSAVPLRLSRIENKWQPVWWNNLPDMLGQIGAVPLPKAESIAYNPLQVAKTNDNLGIDLGLVYSTAFRLKYWIGAGLFPFDRAVLGEQTDAWLSLLGLQRLHPQGIRIAWSMGIPRKKLVNEEVASALKSTVAPNELHIESWYDSVDTAQFHWRYVKEHFALTDQDNDQAIFQGISAQLPDGRSIIFIAKPNPHPSLLPDHTEANLLDSLRQLVGRDSNDRKMGILIELRQLSKYDDAKAALRRLLAHLNVHTQFQIPIDGCDKKSSDQRKAKAQASVLDLRRELGYVGDFNALLNEAVQKAGCASIDPQTQIIGLSLVQRNNPLKRFPVAVKMSIEGEDIRVCLPVKNQPMAWLHYSQAWLKMASLAENGSMEEEQVSQWLNRLVKSLVANECPTVLLVPAVQLRRFWPWLEYENLTYDNLNIGSQIYIPGDVSLETGTRNAPNLRIVWYVADSYNENVFYTTCQEDGTVGLGHGLVKVSDRHYISIAPKPDTYQPNHVWTRLGRKGHRRLARASQAIDIIPAFVQPNDDTNSLATIFHALRISAHWTKGFLTDPLPNHLAALLVNDHLN